MVDIRLRQLSIKIFMLRAKCGFDHYGYLLDDSTEASPRWGMSSWTTKRGYPWICWWPWVSRENQNNRYRYQTFSSFNHKTYIGLWYRSWQGLMGESASILSNYPTNFSNRITSCMSIVLVQVWWHWETLNYSPGIPFTGTYRTLREKGVDVKVYGKNGLRNPRM